MSPKGKPIDQLPSEADPGSQGGGVPPNPENGKPTALVHILTPEFHGFDATEFDDIPDEVVARATADELRTSLYWQYVAKSRRQDPEASAFSYKTPDEEVVSVALTPEEYDKASESITKLAERRYNRVLTQRDEKLRKETGDETARARSEEDIRVAKRGAMRAVLVRRAKMEELLEKGIVPKIELIDKFIEMTEDRNYNLARGTRESVSSRFETLRTTVFDDMLDAIGLKRGWSEDMTDRAKRIIQKRLYTAGTIRDRIDNFKEMLALANEYYGHKRALILTKIFEAKQYQRQHPKVVADILAVDEERRRAKESEKFQLPTYE